MRTLIVTLLFLSTLPLPKGQQTAPAPRETAPQQQHATPAGVSTEETQGLREDIQRMKALADQMDRNLANVSFSQDALKHQFQLEIEMWRLEIARMERRLGPEPR